MFQIKGTCKLNPRLDLRPQKSAIVISLGQLATLNMQCLLGNGIASMLNSPIFIILLWIYRKISLFLENIY